MRDSLPVSWRAEMVRIYSSLATDVFPQDMSLAIRMAKCLDAGTMYINEYFAEEMASSFWGVKKTGIGSERGLETPVNYTQVKNVVINIGIVR